MRHHALCAVVALAWLSMHTLVGGCARCDCEISTSSTDREARMTRARTIEERNRPSSSDEAEIRRSVEEDRGYERRYDQLFLGRVIPGVGCDACSWACERWDLRPMGTEAFKARFRESTRIWLYGETREEQMFGWYENRRLQCVALAHQDQMHQAVRELMGPGEAAAVRYEMMRITLPNRLYLDDTMAMLENLAQDDEAQGYAVAARERQMDLYQELDAGPDALLD